MQTVSFNGTAITPSKIICVGRNYVAHIEELGNEIPDSMVVFNKPNSAICDTLHSRLGGEQLHYEGELAFLVADGQLAGVAFGLDLTKRTLQTALKEKGLPWERAKAFDGAALFSDFVPVSGDLAGLSLRLSVDGEERQSGHTGMMIYQPEAILAQLKTFMTPVDGDIIMTGTPAGVGEVMNNQVFAGRVLQDGKITVSARWQAR